MDSVTFPIKVPQVPNRGTVKSRINPVVLLNWSTPKLLMKFNKCNLPYLRPTRSSNNSWDPWFSTLCSLKMPSSRMNSNIWKNNSNPPTKTSPTLTAKSNSTKLKTKNWSNNSKDTKLNCHPFNTKDSKLSSPKTKSRSIKWENSSKSIKASKKERKNCNRNFSTEPSSEKPKIKCWLSNLKRKIDNFYSTANEFKWARVWTWKMTDTAQWLFKNFKIWSGNKWKTKEFSSNYFTSFSKKLKTWKGKMKT